MLWPHGEYRVGLDGTIIVFQAFGSWNREGSSACTTRIREFVDSLGGNSFGVLIDSFDFHGVTADGYQDWFDAIEYWVDHQLAAVVRVDDVKSMHYKAFLIPFDQVFRETTNFRNLKSVTEALEWLRSYGLKGFEGGMASVLAYGPDGKLLNFHLR